MAWLGWRKTWARAWLVMVLVNLVDLDHLLADPTTDLMDLRVEHPKGSFLWIGEERKYQFSQPDDEL